MPKLKSAGVLAALAMLAVVSQAIGSTVGIVPWDMVTNYRDHVDLTNETWNHDGDLEAPLRTGDEVKDWVKWANYPTWSGGTYNDAMLNAANGGDYQDGGSGQISAVLTKVQTGTAFTARQNNNLFYHNWSDGAITASSDNVVDGIDGGVLGGVTAKLDEGNVYDRDGSGLQLTVNNLQAGTPYRLHLMAGGRHVDITVSATLTDGATGSNVYQNSTNSWKEMHYMIDFTPTTSDQTLTVKVTGLMYYDSIPNKYWGDVIISSAVLHAPAPAAATVAGRHVFYNRSTWDGNNASANASDDAAIATDKVALLPGGTATFSNYTSYSRGINGVMIDVAGLAGDVTAADFAFKVGNTNTPSSWTAAPAPQSITIREGAGVNGSDRVTIIWADNVIQKKWLQVTMLANATTGLSSDDVFYFGNAIGECGNSAADAQVNANDVGGARDNPHSLLNKAAVDDVYDYNRDRLVNAADVGTARDNPTTLFTAVKLIIVP
jgi:hypothetical protein